jgi:hydrogenase maturation protease
VKPPVVIGYGNPLRQDDGIGRRAAELLTSGEAEIICCHQLTPELAIALAGAPLAIFLDAAVDQHPGQVLSRKVFPCHSDLTSHHLAPEQLLDLARTLNGDAPLAYLITGGITQTSLSEMPTREGEDTAARMADVALDLLCYSTNRR